MSLEKWKTITTYKDFVFDGKYEVSSWGNIRCVNTKKPLATYSNGRGQGYLKTKIRDVNNVRRALYLHQLVALNFVQGNIAGLEVNHKDGNVKNNSYTNLEWISHKANCEHYRAGRQEI